MMFGDNFNQLHGLASRRGQMACRRASQLLYSSDFEVNVENGNKRVSNCTAKLVTERGPSPYRRGVSASNGPLTLVRGEYAVSDDPALMDVEAVHRYLCHESYWAKGIPLELVRRSIEGSLAFGLYRDGRQIGFCRFVTDRATFAYLCDVYVAEAERGRGLGRWMIESALGHPGLKGLRRMVLVTRDAHGMYAKLGFSALGKPEGYMELLRPKLYQAPVD
jgi:GNAT superfamily N-acetyltransferase